MPRVLLEDRIYQYLRASLGGGSIPIGAHLKAAAIAASLNVSRTSVRKAIIRLVDDGCVSLGASGRPVVTALPRKQKRKAATVFAFANQTEQAYWGVFDTILKDGLSAGEAIN
jgi:DNA-binding GntR family transcriptional regulator